MTDKDGKYEASDLKNLGEHKFSTTFTILSVDLEEVNKDHFLLVKGSDKKKTPATSLQLNAASHAGNRTDLYN